jgi:hypothetical protein
MRLALALSLLLCAPAWAHEPSAGHENTPAAPVPVQRTEEGAVYGAALPEPTPAPVGIDTIAAKPEPLLGKAGAFSGRIAQVCQKQGCWLVLAGEHGELARVFMHDHGFSVPKDASGDAVVYGTLSEKRLSAGEIEHLKKDGAAAPAARELQIDATSVLIRDAG